MHIKQGINAQNLRPWKEYYTSPWVSCVQSGVTKLKSLYTRYTYLCDSAYLGAVFSFKMYDCNTGILTKWTYGWMMNLYKTSFPIDIKVYFCQHISTSEHWVKLMLSTKQLFMSGKKQQSLNWQWATLEWAAYLTFSFITSFNDQYTIIAWIHK